MGRGRGRVPYGGHTHTHTHTHRERERGTWEKGYLVSFYGNLWCDVYNWLSGAIDTRRGYKYTGLIIVSIGGSYRKRKNFESYYCKLVIEVLGILYREITIYSTDRLLIALIIRIHTELIALTIILTLPNTIA